MCIVHGNRQEALGALGALCHLGFELCQQSTDLHSTVVESAASER